MQEFLEVPIKDTDQCLVDIGWDKAVLRNCNEEGSLWEITKLDESK